MKKLTIFGAGILAAIGASLYAANTIGVPFPLILVAQSFFRSTTEVSASITPTNYGYSVGDARRYGAKGDCSTDDTAALQSVFHIGGTLPPTPGACYKVTSSVFVWSNAAVIGSGNLGPIKLILPGGSPAVPVLDLSGSGVSSTTGIYLSNISIDGGNGAGLIAPTVYGNAIAAGAGILVQSDQTILRGITVNNAWDNGIGIGRMNGSGGTLNARPSYVNVTDVICNHDGYGPGGGACLDNLGGVQVNVSNGIDVNSEFGFIVDLGSGALSIFSNLNSKNPNKGCFYIGSPNTNLTNLQCTAAGTVGIWIDQPSQGGYSTLSNFTSANTQNQGILINGGNWQIDDVFIKNSSAAGSGLFDDILVTGTTSNISNVHINGMSSVGTNHRYGYNEIPNGFTITGGSILDTVGLSGATAAINPTVGALQFYPVNAARLTSGTTRMTTTFTDEAQLHISLLSGRTYAIHGLLFWLCTANSTGLKWNYTFSGTQSLFVESDNFATGAGGGTPALNTQASSLPFGSTEATCGTTAGQFNSAVLDGVITTTSAGTLSLQDAQAIAGGTTTVQIGSYLTALPIG